MCDRSWIQLKVHVTTAVVWFRNDSVQQLRLSLISVCAPVAVPQLRLDKVSSPRAGDSLQ